MPCKKLTDFLEQHQVKYEVIDHPLAYSAQRIAANAGISGRDLAKTVMVEVDGRLAMAVLPASRRVSVSLLREMLQAKNVRVVSEHEFANRFEDCEVGAMPPFGHLWEMEVYVAEALAHESEIAFNAGNHKELIRMAYADYERLAKPKVIRMALGAF